MRIKYYPETTKVDFDSLTPASLEESGVEINSIYISESLFVKIRDFYQSRGFFWRSLNCNLNNYSFSNYYDGLYFRMIESVEYKHNSRYLIQIIYNKERYLSQLSIRRKRKILDNEITKLDRLIMIGDAYYDIYKLLFKVFTEYRSHVFSCDIYANRLACEEVSYLDTPMVTYGRDYYQKKERDGLREMEFIDHFLESSF